MVKFAHMSDVHLGGWKQQPLQDLNFQSFQKAIQTSIDENVEFVLIAGDLFDSAYPPIEVLKETFSEFRKLHDNKIPCFIIAGSHDYSASGKSFLEVLEKTGFCKNVENFHLENEEMTLIPTIHKNFAIYGFRGKKIGLDIKDLKNFKLQDSNLFKILMLHTTIDKAKGDLPIDSIEADSLPEADYCAMGHLHILFQYGNCVYPGPVFPNNFAELENLKNGTFCIVEANTETREKEIRRIDLKIKEIEKVNFEITDAKKAAEELIFELEKRNLNDKIVLLRLRGTLEDSKISEINFQKIEEFIKNKGAYFSLRNTHDLKTKDPEFNIEVTETENLEEEIIKKYSNENNSKFNDLIPLLMNALSIEKEEGETSETFSKRVLSESRNIIKF